MIYPLVPSRPMTMCTSRWRARCLTSPDSSTTAGRDLATDSEWIGAHLANVVFGAHRDAAEFGYRGSCSATHRKAGRVFRRRLDRTVEAQVLLRPEIETLFTAEERNIRRRQLDEYGFRV